MDLKILINQNNLETRIAILENNSLVEIYVERSKEHGIIGNIYKGKILKILPGMQAAFVDVGLEKAGFLYVADIYNYYDDYREMFQGSHDDLLFDEIENFEEIFSEKSTYIQDLIQEGQEILVQIAKEPLGTKGARLTSHITIPGKYLVLVPNLRHVGVSKKICNEEERERLKNIIKDIQGDDNFGFIARTASEGATREELNDDRDFLVKIWNEIRKKYEKVKAPFLLYRDLTLVFRLIRDFYSADISEIIIDNKENFKKVKKFIDTYLPKFKNKLTLYNEEGESLFEKFNIEVDYSKLFNKKVWLKSGGYIVIDKTEALTSIDVNTGKFVGKRELEETVFQTNVEAAKEIAYQLRLRNIGGLIVIDFIDMYKKEDREKLFKIFEEELKLDRSKVHVLKVSELGLVEMTRKRTQDDITISLTSSCPTCGGNGFIKSPATILSEIYRKVIKNYSAYKSNTLSITVHPFIAEILMEEERDVIDAMEKDLGISVEIRSFKKFSINEIERFNIKLKKSSQ
jgi:ribonuclease G